MSNDNVRPFSYKANILLSLQFISDFGDQITITLIALSILDIAQSTSKVGSVYLFTTLGYVVFTLVGGILGDSFGRRNLLCAVDIGRCFVVLILIFAIHEKSLLLIYSTSFLLSVLSALYGPVKISVWADTIPDRYLERYNSLSELSVQSSTIIGPLIASFFVGRGMVRIGFAIDALTFLVCALIISRIVANKLSRRSGADRRNFVKGFSIIFANYEIKKYVAYDAIQMIGFGAFNATLLVLLQRDFGFSKADYSFHLVIVALFTTLGALIGATQRSININPTKKLIACALVSALALYVAIDMRSFPLTSIFVGICDASITLTMAVARTQVQLIAKQFFLSNLSSIIAARFIVIKAATLFGVGICLLAADKLSLETTLLLLIVPIALSVIAMLPRGGTSLRRYVK